MRTIITYGTFDLLHIGHINLLKRARNLGNKLIVGLSTDKFNMLKHKSSFMPFEDRKTILEAIKYVDLVIPEESWDQKINDIKKHNADVFVIGDDWKGEFDHLNDICKVVYLTRTPGISTTQLKAKNA